MTDKTSLPNAGFRRRMGAIIYDSTLILALLIVSSFFIVPLTGEISPGNIFYPFFLYLEVGAFYIYFWCRIGQTLGMQTWRIEVIADDGVRIDLATAILRFVVASLSFFALGIGFFWALFRKDRRMFHDIASDSRVVYLGKPKAKKEEDADKTTQTLEATGAASKKGKKKSG